MNLDYTMTISEKSRLLITKELDKNPNLKLIINVNLDSCDFKLEDQN